MKKLILLLLAVMLALPCMVAANTQDELAMKIVTQNGSEEDMRRVQDNFAKMMADSLKASAECLNQSVVDELLEVAKGVVNVDDTLQFVAGVYAREFTAEELKAIIAFNETPAGKKLIEKSPVIMQQAMSFTQQKVQDKLPEIQAKTKIILADYLDENGQCLKKGGEKEPVGKAPETTDKKE